MIVGLEVGAGRGGRTRRRVVVGLRCCGYGGLWWTDPCLCTLSGVTEAALRWDEDALSSPKSV